MEYKRVTEMLDKAASLFPDRIGFSDQYGDLTFKQMRDNAIKVAKSIVKEFDEDPGALSEKKSHATAVLMEGENDIAAVMHGVLYAGDYYSVIDVEMPKERIGKIIESLDPRLLITNKREEEKARSLSFDGPILVYEDMIKEEHTDMDLPMIICDEVSEDIAGITFTSGSTGVPKGVMTGHKGILYSVCTEAEFLNVNSDDRVGNQPRLYYALGALILYMSIAAMARCYFMPKGLFAEPAALVKYMVDNKLTVLWWPTSGLSMFSRFSVWEGYEKELDENLKVVAFAGDTMSTKLLNKLMKALPSPAYAQLYGATEYYPPVGYYIERPLEDDERVPIGFPLENATVYIVKDNGEEAKDGEEGQLYMGGPGMGIGYLNDEEETNAKFIKDPERNGERLFLTGDIVKKNEYGELLFLSRRDFMIKHMGYRIELAEIELAATSLDDELQCACIYDKEKEHIIMVYAGKIEPKELKARLKEKLQRQMMPNRFIKLDELPLSTTNKIDRMKLKEMYIG